MVKRWAKPAHPSFRAHRKISGGMYLVLHEVSKKVDQSRRVGRFLNMRPAKDDLNMTIVVYEIADDPSGLQGRS